MDSVVYSNGRRGGWVTFPFITGSVIGLTLGGAGWLLNLIVYLIQEFHINSIDAAQIFNFVNGGSNLFTVIGAIIADSLLGSFSVILISSCLSLLGITILALTASLDSLRPQPCENGFKFVQKANEPPNWQYYIQLELDDKYVTDDATMSLTGSVFQDVNVDSMKIDILPEEVSIVQNDGRAIVEMQHESEMQQCH
ncbi:hypothetical protein Patl1_30788 [Pistacia atlantica]|uniref:Uncharacterized protein n=1 Tax=Pistacia atlantica TaxID=434234 RepID=A0ACC1AAK1_9ROSI|nr:hypothetical protein Patl1_30788 [Pistacia atlantica]